MRCICAHFVDSPRCGLSADSRLLLLHGMDWSDLQPLGECIFFCGGRQVKEKYLGEHRFWFICPFSSKVFWVSWIFDPEPEIGK